MALDGNTRMRSSSVSPVGSNCPTPEVSPLENHSSSLDSLDNISPNIIPNRVFVGGFDHKMSESDLWHIFSQYGELREVNIVHNRSRLTKGYGFVTFENSEDARRLLLDASEIYFKEKRLSIRPALRKQHNSENSNGPMFCQELQPQIPFGAVCLTTSSGLPYTFHNGVAYFQSPHASPAQHLWTPPPPPVLVPQSCQPVYHQPAYHHHQPRYVQNHFQWTSVETPVASASMIYAQPEYFPLVLDGASLYHPPLPPLPPPPHMDDANVELCDPVMYQNYSMYPVRERIPRFVAPQEYGKNHMFQSFQVPFVQAYSHNRDHPTAVEQPESQGPQPAQ